MTLSATEIMMPAKAEAWARAWLYDSMVRIWTCMSEPEPEPDPDSDSDPGLVSNLDSDSEADLAENTVTLSNSPSKSVTMFCCNR